MRRARAIDKPFMVKPAQPDLVVRVQSAVVLASIALVATYASAETFAALIAVVLAVMGWEWGRLVRGRGIDPSFAVQLLVTVFAAWATVKGYPAAALLTVIVGTLVVYALQNLLSTDEDARWSAAGVYYAGLPAIALVWLRGDPAHGWHAILFLFIVVWTTDTAAFAFGRLLGGPRLAPSISPAKTWSGLVGGAFAAALAGAAFAQVIGGTPPAALAVLALVLSLAAQLGDLLESAVKRFFGTKDASSLIPGHGGVLDRIDGLISAAFTAGIIALCIDQANPGRALLIW